MSPARELVALFGLALVAWGIAEMYPPAALIFVGASAVLVAVRGAKPATPNPAPAKEP